MLYLRKFFHWTSRIIHKPLAVCTAVPYGKRSTCTVRYTSMRSKEAHRKGLLCAYILKGRVVFSRGGGHTRLRVRGTMGQTLWYSTNTVIPLRSQETLFKQLKKGSTSPVSVSKTHEREALMPIEWRPSEQVARSSLHEAQNTKTTLLVVSIIFLLP
jgi:hypothetical protein